MRESYMPDIHRLLPQSPDAEKGLLGSILLNPDLVLGECSRSGLTAKSFHVPAHQVIYEAIQFLISEGKPADIISLTQILRDLDRLDAAGGVADVSALMTFVPTAVNASYYLEIMQEKHTLRSIIGVCTDYAARAYDEQENVPVLLDEVQRKILEIGKARYEQGARDKSMHENVMQAIDRLSMLHDGSKPPGLLTGIDSIDRKLGGMQKGEVTVLTGTTGGGKTSLAHTVILHAAVSRNLPVMLFSFEMNALAVTNRMICSMAHIDTETMRFGSLTTIDIDRFNIHAARLMNAPIFIDDNADLNIDDIRGRARRRQSTSGLELVVIDYLQKITPTGRGHAMRQREVAIISDGLQKMAMELNVPVLALAQQNPDGEAREARDIIFDSKVALKIKREKEDEDIEKEPPVAKRLLVVCKNNNGSIGSVPLTFLKKYVKFTEYAEERREPERERFPQK